VDEVHAESGLLADTLPSMTEAPRTTFTIAWSHDGARQLGVVIDADQPRHGPMEKRIRSIAEVATSHGALRMLLESAFADQWSVGVIEAVDDVTAVHMVPLDKVSGQDASRQRERDQRGK
jgi:hypothetical protein